METNADNSKGTFDNLNLNETLLKAVYLYGFTEPSKIQIQGISSINTRKDCILQSQSGTGKTATYLLGVMNLLEESIQSCQGIIITPTRELSKQVYDVAIELAKFTNYTIVKCTGGTEINRNELKSATIIIGTLGRIHHMIQDKKININKLKFIVMDEADEMLADGISEKLQMVFEKSPIGKQVVLISATMTMNVFNASKKFMIDPIKVLLKNSEIVVDLISQFYIDVETEDLKLLTLLDLYNIISTSQAIIFCNTVRKVQWLEEELKKHNFTITAIHSNMKQNERDEVVKEFRDGKTRLLLTTDLLSRGIDIPQVNMVVNYDLPANKQTYVHRIGRCGRFDKKGVAISLVKMSDPLDVKTLDNLKYYLKIDIKEFPENIDKYL